MRYCAWTAFLAVVVIAGCASSRSSARLVSSTPTGGCVAIPKPTDHHMIKAHELMQVQCPTGYTIVRQEEVVVGQTTSRRKDQNTKEIPLVKGLVMDVQQTTRDTTTVRDKTEFRIWYEKK